jgi:hypothetical protein
LAKPNYQFQKRRKELEKSRKKEEKRRRKLGQNNARDDADRDSSSAPSDTP